VSGEGTSRKDLPLPNATVDPIWKVAIVASTRRLHFFPLTYSFVILNSPASYFSTIFSSPFSHILPNHHNAYSVALATEEHGQRATHSKPDVGGLEGRPSFVSSLVILVNPHSPAKRLDPQKSWPIWEFNGQRGGPGSRYLVPVVKSDERDRHDRLNKR
jgi:hypothetical protein